MLTSRKKKIFLAVLAAIIVIIVVLRLYLTVWLTNYINARLENVDGYHGSISGISIDLYRGAYKIHQLKLHKMKGKMEVPFLDIEQTDFSLQWGALLHGRIVSEVVLTKPRVNFAIDRSGSVKQTGEEIDWTKRIKELMPIDINRILVNGGKISYRDFSTTPEVNIYLADMRGEVTNLRNVVNPREPLPSDIEISGDSIGGGKLHIKGKANIIKQFPDFNIEEKLEGVALPALNSYTRAYAALDFKKGDFSLYSKLTVKDENLSGYIKPIANNIEMIDLSKDKDPLKILWQALASAIIDIFSNQRKDQFATKIEVSGDLHNVKTSTWSAIGGILHNAFVKAFDKKVDRTFEQD